MRNAREILCRPIAGSPGTSNHIPILMIALCLISDEEGRCGILNDISYKESANGMDAS